MIHSVNRQRIGEVNVSHRLHRLAFNEDLNRIETLELGHHLKDAFDQSLFVLGAVSSVECAIEI